MPLIHAFFYLSFFLSLSFSVSSSSFHPLLFVFFRIQSFLYFVCLCKRKIPFNVIHSKSFTNLYINTHTHTRARRRMHTNIQKILFFVNFIQYIHWCVFIDRVAIDNTKYQRWMNIKIEYFYTHSLIEYLHVRCAHHTQHRTYWYGIATYCTYISFIKILGLHSHVNKMYERDEKRHSRTKLLFFCSTTSTSSFSILYVCSSHLIIALKRIHSNIFEWIRVCVCKCYQ